MAEERIEVRDDQAVHLFSNLISFNVNPEEVCVGMGIRDVQHPYIVQVHSYIHLTIPHFLRFVEAAQKQVDMLIDKGVITREPTQ